MSEQHVHVRRSLGMAVTAEGNLVEQSRCRCGATWDRAYLVEIEDAESE
ncbi:hypothetical protein [Streptomyces sp. GC420]|nr:hypothetical protein [Streptomyces sp. GC420]